MKYFTAQITDGNARVVDLMQVIYAMDDPVFLDECHLNDRRYGIVAESLRNAINDYYSGPQIEHDQYWRANC